MIKCLPVKLFMAFKVTAINGLYLYTHAFTYAKLQPPYFSQPAQTAYSRVTGVCFFMQVIQHLVAVVRPHGNAAPALLHYFNQSLYYGKHINIAVKMVGFKKIAFIISFGAAQVYKVYALRKLAGYGW